MGKHVLEEVLRWKEKKSGGGYGCEERRKTKLAVSRDGRAMKEEA